MHRGVAFVPRGDRRIDVLVEIDGLAPYADEGFGLSVERLPDGSATTPSGTDGSR
jgi:hypothetical protein